MAYNNIFINPHYYPKPTYPYIYPKGVCPSCGRCKDCNRHGPPYPYYPTPYYPGYYPNYPYQPGTVI